MFEEKLLNCKDCGRDFVFTVGEQEFFAGKGFQHDPSRCPECRAARKARKSESGSAGGGYGQFGGTRAARQSFEVSCSQCGAATTVPFKPSEDRPVYCEDCYRQKKRRYY
ncbi:MAG: zinc-ribbon domain containing protein [Peptococcaceae bacterium]|nr:zinc-ribbon domain containing protein [Peptococcaceae bacterium]